MKLHGCFLSLCLYCLIYTVWGQVFNPVPRSQRPTQAPDAFVPRSFTPTAIREAFARAAEIISDRAVAFQGRSRVAITQRTLPSARHQRFQASVPRSRSMETTQRRFEEARKVLMDEFRLTPEQISAGLAGSDLKTMLQGESGIVDGCEAQLNSTDCRRNDKYRTFDGNCNNLQHPSWGRASSCFARLVDPVYSDSNFAKRVAMSGNPLPAPRRVSLEIHSHIDNPTDYVNHMFSAFGQFLDHDFVLTPQSRDEDNQFLDCCPVGRDDPAECDPILIERDDPFFSSFNVTCLSNVRSAMCPTCTVDSPRQQINQLTSYIDASHVYGNNLEISNRLRSNDGTGTLRSVDVGGTGELPPPTNAPNEDECSFQSTQFDCFDTGDVRANQNPGLTSLQIMFLREHNRIARRLREINPRWDEETLYQEARRIVGAEMQMIVYNEYLPLVIGPERMEWFDLSVRPNGEFTQYDDTVQGSLLNEFAAAAFRFGHSMVNSFFQNPRASNGGSFLRDSFNFPFPFYSRGQYEGMVEGLTLAPSQKFDRYVIRDLTNHLYQARNGTGSGLDLASLNVNRGRDHGIPGYTKLVEFCGGPVITRWRDLDRFFQRGMRQRFETLYERVEDIDLFSGGLAERPNQGAVIGPTFTCIIGIQFYHLKYGDRFFFEHGGQAGSFTPAQLRELKKVTFSKIICDNSDVDEAVENAFLYQGSRNPMVRCNRKPSLDLNAWRE